MNGESAQEILIYTDGACMGSGASRPGGYAAVIVAGDRARTIVGWSPATTSTAMELMGAIGALEALPPATPARIHTDSQYVVVGATERLPWWRSRGWRIVKGGRLADRDLWQRLAVLLSERPVAWIWVKGHAGDLRNEEAHRLAYEQARLAAAASAPSRPAGAGRRGLAKYDPNGRERR